MLTVEKFMSLISGRNKSWERREEIAGGIWAENAVYENSFPSPFVRTHRLLRFRCWPITGLPLSCVPHLADPGFILGIRKTVPLRKFFPTQNLVFHSSHRKFRHPLPSTDREPAHLNKSAKFFMNP
jgi:hypothetical protein